MIVPLHSSLDNRVRPSQKKKKKYLGDEIICTINPHDTDDLCNKPAHVPLNIKVKIKKDFFVKQNEFVF